MDKGVKEEKARTKAMEADKKADKETRRLAGAPEGGAGAPDAADEGISFNGVSVGAPEPGGGHRILIKELTMNIPRGRAGQICILLPSCHPPLLLLPSSPPLLLL